MLHRPIAIFLSI